VVNLIAVTSILLTSWLCCC